MIRQSRTKLALTFALFAALAVVLAFMTFISQYMPGMWSYLALSLFAPVGLASAAAAVMTGRSLAQPGILIIDDSGVCHKSWRQDRRYPWGEIAEFIVFSPEHRMRSPGCALKEGQRKYVSFGRNWEKPAEEIVEILNEAKQKYGAPPSA